MVHIAAKVNLVSWFGTYIELFLLIKLRMSEAKKLFLIIIIRIPESHIAVLYANLINVTKVACDACAGYSIKFQLL